MSASATDLQQGGGRVRTGRTPARLTRDRPLRILTFSSLFPNAEQPTHGLFVWRRLQQLLGSGAVDATVVAPVPWFPLGQPRFGTYAEFARVPRQEMLAGVPVHHPRYFVVPKLGMNLAPALLALGVRNCVAKLHRAKGFDLIDAHYFYPDGVAAALIGGWLDLPVSITARGTDLNVISEHVLPRAMIRWAADRSRLNLAVSTGLAARLHAIGADPAKTRTIRNGVDLQLFRPLDRAASRRALGVAERNWLLSAGQLIPTKGHDAVIRAVAQLPGWGLLIAGHGPEEGSLRALAREAGLAHRVVFRGRVSPDEMPTLFSAADCLVLASAREGMPNVVLESLACGTPVIATRVGDCPDMLRDPIAGRLVERADPAEIAAALRELMRAPPAREAVADYARRFSWAPSVEAQLEEFRRIARSWIA